MHGPTLPADNRGRLFAHLAHPAQTSVLGSALRLCDGDERGRSLEPTGKMPDDRNPTLPRAFWLLPLALGVLAAVGFGGLLENWFLLDDFMWLHDAQRQVEEPSLFFTLRPSRYFRPAGNLFFGLEYLAFGLAPLGYYLVNIGLHVWCASWLGGLAWTLWHDRHAVAIASVLFVVTASWSGAVTWISAFVTLLGAAILLPTLVSQVLFLRHGNRFWYAATLVGTALCVCAKESTISVGPLLLLLELRERGARSFLRPMTWLRYAPFALLAWGYTQANSMVSRTLEVIGPLKLVGAWLRGSLVTIGEMVLPAGADVEPLSALLVGAGLLIALIAAMGAAGGRQKVGEGVGIALALVFAFVPFAYFMSRMPSGLSSRYGYLPGLFLCLFVGRAAGLVLARCAGKRVFVTAAFWLLIGVWAARELPMTRARAASNHFRQNSQRSQLLVEGLLEEIGAVDEHPPPPGERWLFVGMPIAYPRHFQCLAATFLGVPIDGVQFEWVEIPKPARRAEITAGGGRALLQAHDADRMFIFIEGLGLQAYDPQSDPQGSYLWSSFQRVWDFRRRPRATVLFTISP